MYYKRSFASDNNSGVHDKIMEAVVNANKGHVVGYGDDRFTKAAEEKFKEVFGKNMEVYFVYNGTGANVMGLTSMTDSFNSIICSETAHINVDECGAPEKFSGCKLVTLPSEDGKIRVSQIKGCLHAVGDQHHSQPKVVSITQATELGTVYTPDEIREIADFVHENGMYLHMDGARIANAAASLGLGLREITRDVGVDVLSFGGTKNGMMFGEAVVFFNTSLSKGFKFLRKQGMQLASKMRYISVQFETLLSDDLWLKNARHANSMAELLKQKIEGLPGIQITQKVETNAVFAKLPCEIIPKLKDRYFFYEWDEENSEVRWMTSFDTTEEDVRNFVEAVKEVL